MGVLIRLVKKEIRRVINVLKPSMKYEILLGTRSELAEEGTFKYISEI